MDWNLIISNLVSVAVGSGITLLVAWYYFGKADRAMTGQIDLALEVQVATLKKVTQYAHVFDTRDEKSNRIMKVEIGLKDGDRKLIFERNVDD